MRKKETLTVNLKAASQDVVAKGVEQSQFDNWNKERQDYGKTYADNQGYGGPSHAYGMQDLNYYGDFFYAGGYGYVWQPYGFAGSMIDWNPYMNGAWMFYPGMGYSWASAYPWGWLPFHYGSWAFINGAGWAWVPGRYSGGQWFANAYQVVPRVTKAPAGWTAPAPPVTTATATSSPTVLVGKAGTAPLSIPGGRIPPNFASLVPGRAVGADERAWIRTSEYSDGGCQPLCLRGSAFRDGSTSEHKWSRLRAAGARRCFRGRSDCLPDPRRRQGGSCFSGRYA